MVGAVVVDDEGVVIGRGSHESAGGPHAEVHALRDAGDRARGATLYCTLEPCSHTGRTGPCAPLVADAGIRRVVVASEDPNPKVSGRGLDHLRARGVDVTVGVLSCEAETLNRGFFTLMRLGRPFVTLKAAVSLDGRVAAAPGQRTALTGAASARLIHRERAEVDAIGIGSETLLVDDPVLTARVAYRHRPLTRVVFDRRLRTRPSARLFTTLAHGAVVVMTSASAIAERLEALTNVGAHVEPIDNAADPSAFLHAAMARLATLGVTSLLVEGGPTLQEAFWRAGLVDRIELFVAPRNLGADGVPWMNAPEGALTSLRRLHALPVGDDVRIEGDVHRPC
jgi:diaminohydroxyphosphoribosylaminopyrimidine deaminase/5-amino-6-(5-phosphoribosylamino)uracil reductase